MILTDSYKLQMHKFKILGGFPHMYLILHMQVLTFRKLHAIHVTEKVELELAGVN